MWERKLYIDNEREREREFGENGHFLLLLFDRVWNDQLYMHILVLVSNFDSQKNKKIVTMGLYRGTESTTPSMA